MSGTRPSRRLAGVRIAAALLAAALLAGLGLAQAAPSLARARALAATTENPDEARVIVRFRSGGALMRAQAQRAQDEGVAATHAVPRHAQALGQRHGLALVDGHAISPTAQVLFAHGMSSSMLAARLAQDPDVETAAPDRRRHRLAVPNDPLYPGGQASGTPAVGQWYLRAPSANLVSAVDAAGAWDTTFGSSAITVAVLDSGVRFDHPDLAGRFFPGHYGYDFIADRLTANDGDDLRDSDASDPGDWVTQADVNADPQNCFLEDSSWHGTQVAGLIAAATDNGIGMAGVARNVMLLPVRVLGKCGGFDSDIQAGMRWAAGLTVPGVPDNLHPARIVNLSLGGTGACDNSTDAGKGYLAAFAELAAANVTIVVAAGNDNGLAIGLPANCPGAIAVTGVTHLGTKADFSNVGPEATLAAPGGDCGTGFQCSHALITTTNAGLQGPTTNTYTNAGASASLGTSFASPLVAGAAALLLSVNSALTPAQVSDTLKGTARAFPASGGVGNNLSTCHAPNGIDQGECFCTTATCGAGMLDVAAAVSQARANLPVARIAATPYGVDPGGTLTFNSAGSSAPAGATIASYLWELVDGAAFGSITSANNAATATVAASAVGAVTMRLTVTDSRGAQASATDLVVIGAPAVPPTTTASTPTSDSGGGGGALSGEWLLGLAAAVLALVRRRASATGQPRA